MKLVKLKEILEDCACGLPVEKMKVSGGDFTVTTEWYDCRFAEYLYLKATRRGSLAIIQLSCDRGVLYHRMYKK